MTLIDLLCSHKNPVIAYRARRLLAGESESSPAMCKLRRAIGSSEMAKRLLLALNGERFNPYRKWGLFLPLLDKKAPPEAKAYALEKYVSRLDYVEDHLRGREYLLGHFSVADVYLVTVINWTMATPPIELAKWPALKAYYERLRSRPSVAKAVAEEFELYKAEIARHKAAA